MAKEKLGLFTILYAIFYTFCLYKNMGGATFPFFVIGTLFYMSICLKGFNHTLKKDSIFIMIAITLISVSQMLTDNEVINALNVFVVFIALIWLFIHNFYEDENSNIFATAINLAKVMICSLGNIFAPFKDFTEARASKTNTSMEETEKKSSKALPIILTIIISIPVLAIVISLLSSADAVFSSVVSKVFSFDWINKNFFGIFFLTLVVFFLTYGLITHLSKSKPFVIDSEKKADSVIAITACSLFDVVYLVFSVIQILFLFIGNFTLPDGYTYAEYAREGFFQLLFVCIINLGLVLIANTFFGDNKALKILLTIMCLCTFIMTASSAFRMILYIRYFYFTFLRLFVLWALAMISILMAGLLLYTWRKTFRLEKFLIIGTLVCYLFLSFSHVDYFIAKWNLSQAEGARNEFFLDGNGYSDYNYLYRYMSSDAAPVLNKNTDFNSHYPQYKEELVKVNIGLRDFNLSKYIAKKGAQK